MNETRNQHELDSDIREALACMLESEPTAGQVDDALARLKSSLPVESFHRSERVSLRNLSRKSPRRSIAIACSIMFFLCVIASSDAWAQVTQEFSEPSNAPQPISTLSDKGSTEAATERLLGFGNRLLLLSHIVSLMLGILGMAITWLIATGKCLVRYGRHSQSPQRSRLLEQRTLLWAIAFYITGVLLGCVWSQLAWGRPWNWDPRESFSLCTIVIGSLWLTTLRGSATDRAFSKNENASIASRATIAFGSVVLMFSLGNYYTTRQHSYGESSQLIPTSVLVFFLACLLIIWIFSLLTRGANSAANNPST